VLDSIEEALRIGEIGDLPVHISHIKNSGRSNWGRSAQVVGRIERARAEGRRVTADQYAYDASSTSIDILFPSAALSVGRREFGEKLRADRGFRQQMRDSLLATMKRVGFGDLRYARIASAPGNSLLSGLTIQEAAAARGDDSPDAQAELAMDVMADAEGKRVSMVYHTMSEEDVQRYMRQDWIAVAADGGLRLQGEQEKPHPRSCGNNPRVLRRYVRELGVLELAAAVRKMTSLPAEIFSLDDRGVLREGAYADVCVFDPQTVADEATFDQPLLAPTGIRCVLVNGRLAVRDGEVLPRRNGHVLRSGG
jgi:N-acyl-D-amino-acid deacylase